MIPFFTSHYSIGKSILKIDDIAKLAKENSLKEVFLIENNFSGFREAYDKLGSKLRFGLKLKCGQNSHKNILLATNTDGYNALIKIYNAYATELNYSLTYEELAKYWCEGLVIVVPFYDSFLHLNALTMKHEMVNLSQFEHYCAVEDNDLPFDSTLKKAVEKYCKGENVEMIDVQSVYYKEPKAMKAWQTFRCMHRSMGRVSSIYMPNMDHCCSNGFNFEKMLQMELLP